jgi:uncharacterized protein involved in response to NO
MNATQPALLLPTPRILAAAPHRLLFLAGAANVLLAMTWWTLWLIDLRWQAIGLPQPEQNALWLHGMLMQYQVLPSFMFGFLLTVFPRWMGLPDLSVWHYLPVGIGLFAGQLLTLLGALGLPVLLHVGAVFTLAGWLAGAGILVSLLRRESGRTWHARSCGAAIVLGALGWTLHVIGMHMSVNSLTPWALRLGGFGLLVPVYLTVAHRMFPFFASNVAPGYTPWRPLWVLAVFWPLALGHVLLDGLGLMRWLWLTDAPFALLAAFWLWKIWPRGRAPALLRVLFIGFAWLPLALLLFTAQSLALLVFDTAILGRAPAHAMFVGFFGSLLVAMVTRVTQGHSGRPLELGVVPGVCFVLLQGVALLRIGAELASDRWAMLAVAGLAWLLAFAPWVLRSAYIYLTPRLDRRPG